MIQDTPLRKPWWKRKRWIAAGVVWLVLMYPLSLGPFIFAFYEDLIPDSTLPYWGVVYAPFNRLEYHSPRLHAVVEGYTNLWFELHLLLEEQDESPIEPPATVDDLPSLPDPAAADGESLPPAPYSVP